MRKIGAAAAVTVGITGMMVPVGRSYYGQHSPSAYFLSHMSLNYISMILALKYIIPSAQNTLSVTLLFFPSLAPLLKLTLHFSQ